MFERVVAVSTALCPVYLLIFCKLMSLLDVEYGAHLQRYAREISRAVSRLEWQLDNCIARPLINS